LYNIKKIKTDDIENSTFTLNLLDDIDMIIDDILFSCNTSLILFIYVSILYGRLIIPSCCDFHVRIEIPNVDAIVLFRPITDHDVFPRLIIFTISRLLVICSCVVDRETPSTLSRPTVDR
jgi:hypothetical protein